MRTKYAEPDAPLKSNAGMPSVLGSIDRFAAPAAPHSRQRFGKPLPSQSESCDVRTALLFSAAGRAEEVTAFHLTSRPAFPQAFRETAPVAIRKSRCADGIALLRGSMSERIHFASRPAFPTAFRETPTRRNPKAAMCGRSCFSARQGERMNGTSTAAPHSRQRFGKPLPPQTESCDVRTALLFSTEGGVYEWDRRCRFTAG